MKQIRFDFNNMLDSAVGSSHGVTEEELSGIKEEIKNAHLHLQKVFSNRADRLNLGLEWAELPYQDEKIIRQITALGNEIAAKSENVVFLGIGGSFLGLKAAQDALCLPYFNEFKESRRSRPRVYFEGNNLDPDTLNILLKNINPRKTTCIVISKSGETTETKAAFEVVSAWLKKSLGKNYGRRIIAITDPASGTLRRIVNEKNSFDPLSFRSLPLLKGVGGRFSELNIGLLHLAITGVSIKKLLAGAADMHKRCLVSDISRNPAYMYSALVYMLYKSKAKNISIMMPFSEALKSTADWYSQLLAESLGKQYERKVSVSADGSENWLADTSRIFNAGRTPVASRGTNDLHSIQQNNIEGRNDKVVTFIKVEKFSGDIKVPAEAGIISGKKYSELMNIAQEATEWALVRNNRPNCTIIMPEISAYTWGQLIFFFEMATAVEGELLNVNAYDQPGVESYKNYMYYKLGKPGLSQSVIEEIEKNPLIKKENYIL